MIPDLPVFRPFTQDLLASAVRLSTQAGWNQTGEDWLRLATLRENAVMVYTDADEVRASYSLVDYGSKVAWIGMILVDQAYRGNGLGKRAFQEAVKAAQGYEIIGLDATDLGEPIYTKLGFEVIGSITRWQGQISSDRGMPVCTEIRRGLHPGVLALDAECTRVDRSKLLFILASEGAEFTSHIHKGETIAYAVLRKGRVTSHLGPLVSTSQESIKLLLWDLAKSHHGKSLLCDVLNSDLHETLTSMGLSPLRHLKRMTSPRSEDCLNDKKLWFAAGFELG